MELKERSQAIRSITIQGLVVNILLIIVKFIAGILGKSAAMVADAVHSVSDMITDFAVLAGARYASKPKDDDHNFGHGKIETISTVFVGLMLFGAGVYILYSGVVSIKEFLGGTISEGPSILAFYMALVSIVVKEYLYRITVKVGHQTGSTMVVANAWHHRSDALSSIGTMAGIGGAVFLGNDWFFLDPLAAVIVSIFIFKLAIKLTYDSLRELSEAALPAETQKEIIAISSAISGVIEPHNLKTRKLGSSIAVDMHIYVDDTLNIAEAHELTRLIENALKERFGDDIYISIHQEPLSIKK